MDQLRQQDEPARRSETGQGEGEADVDRGEVGQRHSCPDSDVEAMVGSGPRREGSDADDVKVEQVHPPPSAPSIPHSGKPDGMLMWLFQLPPHLIPPSDCVDASAIPDRDVQEDLRPCENPEPIVADDSGNESDWITVATATDDSGNKSDWRSTVSATAELLRGVKGGPLKSVAGGLCIILENCGVRPPSCTFNEHCSWSFQRTEVDRRAIESLAPRVKTLSESLCAPIPKGDVNEKQRTRKLER